MSIASDLIRGNTDMIILAHLALRDSYGYEINKLIAEKSGGRCELKEATLYGAFRRLEDMGAITSFWGDETTGARRRYYRITAEGIRVLDRCLADWREARDVIDGLIARDGEKSPERDSDSK